MIPRRAAVFALALTPLLAAAAALAAVPATGASGTLRPASRTAGPASPITHVVVIYEENHSFDSLLGFWCDQNPGRCPDGGMPASVTLSSGAVVTPATGPDVVPQVRHWTIDQQNAIDGGAMDGWQKIPGCTAAQHYACIEGYQPSQMPGVAALAHGFAISDATFSMQDSPSWFGHLSAVAATTGGFSTVGLSGRNPFVPKGVTGGHGWGCDSNKVATWTGGGTAQNEPSCIPDPALPLPHGGAFGPTPVPQVPTIMDRLGAAGLPWRIYGAACTSEAVAPTGLERCTAAPSGYLWSVCPTFAECLYSQPADSPDTQFAADATSGALPAFSLVTPASAADSWHNGFSVTTGDNWLGKMVGAVENGPDWSSTAIFVTWDDCGCFYDQVPPGTNPDGTPQGPRVPLLIVSPYAKPGYTDTTPTTFAGILAYTEQNFGLAPLSANDAAAYPFTNAFDYSQVPLRPVRMVTRPVPKGDHIVWSQVREDS